MAPASSEYSASVLRLGCGFFLIFCAFNTSQALISTLLSDKKLAYATLGLLYAVFVCATVVAPKIVDRIGPRLAITLGAVPYVLFVFANIYPVWATLLPASAAVGLGAAILWTGQGIYLSRCAVREAALTRESVDDVTSRFNATFWTLFQFNAAVGLVISSIVLGRAQAGDFALASAIKYMFTAFGAIGAAGVAVIFSLKNAPPMEAGEGSLNDGAVAAKAGGGQDSRASFYDTLSLLATSRAMQLLLPAIFFNGASLGFFNATFPLVWQDPASDSGLAPGLLPSSFVGYQAATFYLSNSLFSFAWGKLVPRVGRRSLFLVTLATVAAFFCVLLLQTSGLLPAFAHGSAGAYIYVLGLAVAFAAGDSVMESQLPAIIQSPTFFPVERERDAANSVLRMLQSLGYCTQFAIGIGASCTPGAVGAGSGCQLQAAVLLPLLLVALACIYICDRFVRPIEAARGGEGEYAVVPWSDE